MKLTLHNFRCHTNATYEIPDSGLVLLSGSSGSGKSTILSAISYALFGSIAVRKPYSFGTKTCRVTLDFMNMKICRTNTPNRLVVNDNLEDAAAQSFINEKIRVGYDEFLISSYIPQKNNSSVLSLSQADQLRLIKTLAFEQEENEAHKIKLNKMIRESSALLTKKHSAQQLYQKEVDRISESIEPIDFPLAVEDDETEEDAIKNYKERMRTFNKRIDALIESKTTLNDELLKNIHTKAELELVLEKLDRITMQQQKVTDRHQQLQELLKTVPVDLQEKVDNTQKSIKYLETKNALDTLKEQYAQIKQNEKHDRDQQRLDIEKELWLDQDYETASTNLEQLQEKVQLWKQFQTASIEFKALQDELELYLSQEKLVEHYKSLLDDVNVKKTALYKQKESLMIAAEKLALEKEIVNCPECKVPLRWKDNALVSVHDHQSVENRDYSSEIKNIERQLGSITSKKTLYEKMLQRICAVNIPPDHNINYDEIKGSIQRLTTYITTNNQREIELKRILHESADNYITPALKGLSQQINNKTAELKKVSAYSTDKDLHYLRDNLLELNEHLKHYNSHKAEMIKVSAELSELEKNATQFNYKVQKLQHIVAEINEDKVKRKIANIDRNIATAKSIQAEDDAMCDAVEQYLVYCEQEKELERWENKLANSTKKLNRVERIHEANLTLKERYIQAEILALESTIKSINEHTRYYLDTFFVEHHLSATLEAVHKDKKIDSLKINTTINYKGNTYDSINQLSGGEFDRCTLASICGINSMVGSPFLILDESLASLDTDTNTEIIRFLSELAEDKLIIVCSHEAVRGIFDTVIEL